MFFPLDQHHLRGFGWAKNLAPQTPSTEPYIKSRCREQISIALASILICLQITKMGSTSKTTVNIVFGAMTFGKEGEHPLQLHDP